MPCQYCDSLFHVSENCNVYLTDECRKEISLIKKCGPYSDCHSDRCPNHPKKRKCYICFSKEQHHTVHCPEKSNAPNFFLPKIDADLLPRFVALLNPIEQFLLASPSTLKYLKLQRFEITNTIIFAKTGDTPKLWCSWYFDGQNKLEIFKHSKNLYLKAVVVNLKNWRIERSLFFRFFCSFTEQLKIHSVEITPKVTLFQIISKLPNLKKLAIQKSNIEIENSWPKDMLNCIDASNDMLSIKLSNISLDFNVDDFVLMKNKNLYRSGGKIYLIFPASPTITANMVLEEIEAKFSKNFTKIENEDEEICCQDRRKAEIFVCYGDDEVELATFFTKPAAPFKSYAVARDLPPLSQSDAITHNPPPSTSEFTVGEFIIVIALSGLVLILSKYISTHFQRT